MIWAHLKVVSSCVRSHWCTQVSRGSQFEEWDAACGIVPYRLWPNTINYISIDCLSHHCFLACCGERVGPSHLMVVRCSRNRLNDSVEDMVQPPSIFPRAMNIMNPCCLVEPTIQRRMYSNLLASHQKIRKLQDMDQTWSDNTSQSSHRSRLRHHRCFGYHGCRFGWFKLQTVWTSRMMNYRSKAPVPKWPCATVNTGGQRSERPRSMDCLDYF